MHTMSHLFNFRGVTNLILPEEKDLPELVGQSFPVSCYFEETAFCSST